MPAADHTGQSVSQSASPRTAASSREVLPARTAGAQVRRDARIPLPTGTPRDQQAGADVQHLQRQRPARTTELTGKTRQRHSR
jgi:hypothetical protein